MTTFMTLAYFKDVKVMALSAIGTPGCLRGPKLDAYITAASGVAGLTGPAKQVRDAVAEGVSECFEKWRAKVTIPGLPWYPSFSAWPGPNAPPTPNVPTPLVTLVSSQLAQITVKTKLRNKMTDNMHQDVAGPKATEFCDNIATSLAIAYPLWLATTQVNLAMGYGPVPAFAPPIVPVGPVVGGTIIPAPGPLASGSFTVIAMPLTLP